MIITLIRKEVKELLTKSSLLFFVAMALMFVFMGQMLSSSFEGATIKPVVSIVDNDNNHHSQVLISGIEASADIIYTGTSKDSALAALKTQKGVAAIVIPAGFSSSIDSSNKPEIEIIWLMKGSGLVDSLPVVPVEAAVRSGMQAISASMVAQNTNLDPEIILSPASLHYTTIYEGRTIEGISPQVVSGLLSQETMFVPIVIMMLIVMGSSSVISSMGLEKENRTLETLLTLPVRRSHIILSKIIGSAIVGIIMGAIYMAGFVSYFGSISDQAGSLSDFGFSLNAADYLLIALSLFTALLTALCASIILGTFASNYRSAQTLTYPLIGLAMLAMLVTMMLDFRTLPVALQILVFVIPFSHPMIAMKELLVGNYLLVLGGIAYCMALTGVLVAIATKIFTTDRVVLGMSFKRKQAIDNNI